MSTQTSASPAVDLVVVAADTLITNTSTVAIKALLPPISGMTDGDEIRLSCTGGAPMVVETEDGKLVGIVPGRGQAVVVAESGSGDADFWRFQVRVGPFSPFVSKTSHAASAAATAATGVAVAAQTAVNLVDELLDAPTLAIDATIEKFKTTDEVIVRIAGVQKNQAALTAQVFSAADTINTAAGAGLLWGIWLIQMDVAGAVTTKSPSADQTYADEATAITALPSADAGKVGIGRITVEAKTGAAWTANTDALDSSDTNAVNFVNFAVTDLVQAQIDAIVADYAAIKAEFDKVVTDLGALITTFDSNRALVNTAGTGLNAAIVALIDQGLMLAE